MGLTAIAMRHEARRWGLEPMHLTSREEPAAQEALFVFSIQQNHLHDDILALTQQGIDIVVSRPIGRGNRIPCLSQSFELI
jgi:hypothetical protein